MPEVKLYGKEGCGICEAALKKLKLLAIPSQKLNIGDFTDFHEGWGEDGSLEVSSAFFMRNQRLPIIMIGSEYYDYPSAMKKLKELKGADQG